MITRVHSDVKIFTLNWSICKFFIVLVNLKIFWTIEVTISIISVFVIMAFSMPIRLHALQLILVNFGHLKYDTKKIVIIKRGLNWLTLKVLKSESKKETRTNIGNPQFLFYSYEMITSWVDYFHQLSWGTKNVDLLFMTNFWTSLGFFLRL